MNSINERVRKSEKMSDIDFSAFKNWVDSQDTKTDAVEKLDITPPTLDRIYHKGSGKPATIKKILKVINEA